MKAQELEQSPETRSLPPLTALSEREGKWFVSKCPELGVASQGRTQNEAFVMLTEAVELWLEEASPKEIKRRLKHRGAVRPLELAHA